MPSGTGGIERDGNAVLSILEARGVAPDIIAEVKDALDSNSVFVPEPVPPLRNRKGELDARHFQARLANLANQHAFLSRNTSKGVPNYGSVRDGILREARMVGINAQEVLEDRTADDRGHDLGMRILTAPKTIWEGLDDEIEHIERACIAAVRGTKAYLDAHEDKVREEAERTRRSGKAMLRRLARIKRLRMCCRMMRPERTEAIPESAARWPALSAEWRMAWAASWVLRLMCYVYRTDRSDDFATSRSSIFDIGPHHCKMSADVYIAENRMAFFVEGTDEEAEQRPDIFAAKGRSGWRLGVLGVCGAIIQVPPRHGKSMFGTAWMVGGFDLNPRLQCLMGHAIEDKCGENMRHVKAAFDRNEPIGRRNLSLFPSIRMADEDNDKWRMRLHLEERTRDPQIRARGVRGGVGGGNADRVWMDDPVDPREANQPTKRDETSRLITHQWLRRLQGRESFTLFTHTPWHPDDGVCRLAEQSVADSRANPVVAADDSDVFLVSRQPVGGPNTKKADGGAFFSIWDGQPSPALRLAFKQMQDPWAYSCQFMMDPRPDSARIIKQIALYVSDISNCDLSQLPEEVARSWVDRWEAHRQFLRTAKNHLSFDPTATSKERAEELLAKGDKNRRDMAGLVYCGVGPVRETSQTLGEFVETSTRIRIRILDADKFYCSPTEAIDKLGEYALADGRRVDVVHVEEVTGFVAVSEGLRNKYGLSPDQVVGHRVHNLDKATRLKAVSPMLDDSLRHKGLEPPVVEFPGILNEDGVLIPDPRLRWFINTILDFAFSKDRHCVDALTQMLKFLAPEVNVGGGAFTTAVRVTQDENDLSDRARRIAHLMEDYRNDEVPEYDGATFA